MGLFYYRVFIFLLKTFKHNENIVIIFFSRLKNCTYIFSLMYCVIYRVECKKKPTVFLTDV